MCELPSHTIYPLFMEFFDKRGSSLFFFCCCNRYIFFFFFSSRRRHTRCSRDWSSDVCSSDLDVWAALLRPAGWWNGEHTYSGNPANLSLDPVAGGCFCEAVPGAGGGPAGQVEHMRVIYLAPYSTLRSEERRAGKEWRSRAPPW